MKKETMFKTYKKACDILGVLPLAKKDFFLELDLAGQKPPDSYSALLSVFAFSAVIKAAILTGVCE